MRWVLQVSLLNRGISMSTSSVVFDLISKTLFLHYLAVLNQISFTDLQAVVSPEVMGVAVIALAVVVVPVVLNKVNYGVPSVNVQITLLLHATIALQDLVTKAVLLSGPE
ncbi:hypothetical protein NL676_014445 [Syzygium grande]|nr:hypothetical protein NL676_014445 [Syzygium grande]